MNMQVAFSDVSKDAVVRAALIDSAAYDIAA